MYACKPWFDVAVTGRGTCCSLTPINQTLALCMHITSPARQKNALRDQRYARKVPRKIWKNCEQSTWENQNADSRLLSYILEISESEFRNAVRCSYLSRISWWSLGFKAHYRRRHRCTWIYSYKGERSIWKHARTSNGIPWRSYYWFHVNIFLLQAPVYMGQMHLLHKVISSLQIN